MSWAARQPVLELAERARHAASLAAVALRCRPSSTGRFVEAIWRARLARLPRGAGRLLGFIGEKHRFILFGTYPFEQHWRPALATWC
jgi:hypothetical protein